jgi:hypothetical protein
VEINNGIVGTSSTSPSRQWVARCGGVALSKRPAFQADTEMTRGPLPSEEDHLAFEEWAREVDRFAPPKPTPNREPPEVSHAKDRALLAHHVTMHKLATGGALRVLE